MNRMMMGARSVLRFRKARRASAFRRARPQIAAVGRASGDPLITFHFLSECKGRPSAVRRMPQALPRYEDDGVGLVWPRRDPALETRREYASKIILA